MILDTAHEHQHHCFKLDGVLGKESGEGSEGGDAYANTLVSTQHNPNVQPTAVSPRMLRQLRTRSGEKGFPAARAVKKMRAVAMV